MVSSWPFPLAQGCMVCLGMGSPRAVNYLCVTLGGPSVAQETVSLVAAGKQTPQPRAEVGPACPPGRAMPDLWSQHPALWSMPRPLS